MRVRSFMTKGVESVGPGCTVKTAANLMRRRNIGALLVREGDVLVGILTDRDIVVRASARGGTGRMTAAEVMTSDPARCYDEADINIVAGMMRRLKIRRLPVVDRAERPVGMLSLDDLAEREGPLASSVLRAVAAKRR